MAQVTRGAMTGGEEGEEGGEEGDNALPGGLIEGHEEQKPEAGCHPTASCLHLD